MLFVVERLLVHHVDNGLDVPGSQNVFLNSLTSSILPTLSSLLQSIGNHMESCFCDARFLFWANECVLVTRLQMEASRLGHVTQEIRGNIKQSIMMLIFQYYCGQMCQH